MIQYKDSGNSIIGKIPANWQLMRLKDVGYLYGGLTGKAGDDFDVNEENDNFAFFIPFTNIFNNTYISADVLGKVKVSDDEKQNAVHKGDLLFLMSSEDYDGIGKPSVIDFELANLYLNSFCKGFRITANINAKFLNYLMSSHVERELVRLEAKGFIRINLRQDKLACCNIIVPSRGEQDRIADYLDKKCGEIDSLIGLQEQMIEKLKAYKQSVITEAVTKGLAPNAELVPSGIDWIGDIPEGWKLLKTLFVLKMPITDGPHTTPNLYDTGIPFVSAEAVSCGNGSIDFSHIRGYISQEFYEECCQKYIPEIDDIYMIKSGATTGKVSIVDTDRIFTIWSPLAVFRSNPKMIIARYLFYTIQADYYQKQISLYWTFGTQQNIGMRTLEQLLVVLPSLSEQQCIVSFLDTKCADIDRLISMKEQKIEKLKDYKKSVIYEAVTGKIEID